MNYLHLLVAKLTTLISIGKSAIEVIILICQILAFIVATLKQAKADERTSQAG